MITAEKVPHSGAWIISSVFQGYLVTRTYYGYSLQASKRLYQQELGRLRA